MIRVAVVGAAGRMGTHVLRAVEQAENLAVASAVEYAAHPDLGKEVSPGIPLSADLATALENAQVAIDFSTPGGSAALARAAAPKGVALVIATTGLDDQQSAALEQAAQRVAVVRSANFSLGVAALVGLVEQAVKALPDYEIEVLEMHHSRKADAPSGTALWLAEAAAAARGQKLADVATYHREGQTGPRPPDAIGMQTLRGGDVVGEHTVYLVGRGERLELSHRALSRENFARGAVQAARWAATQPPGLYTLRDVLS